MDRISKRPSGAETDANVSLLAGPLSMIDVVDIFISCPVSPLITFPTRRADDTSVMVQSTPSEAEPGSTSIGVAEAGSTVPGK
jgi:hypothetical protein